MSFRVTLTTAFAGGDYELEPLSLSLTSSLSSPARSLWGRFTVPDFPPEFLRARVEYKGRLLFEGCVDRQQTRVDENGVVLEVEARDKGAALLDNEARPKAYQNLTVHRMFEELIAPHGFLLVDGYPTIHVPAFTIRKGQSLWDAFCTLARLSYGHLPYVRGDMVITALPTGGETWVLGGKDYPFSSLSHTVNHYPVLSQVYIRDEAGNYTTAVGNPEAQSRGISRTRYFIPAGEYDCKPQWDADQRIRRSMRQMVQVELEMPGILEISPGETVWIHDKLASLPNLQVEEITLSTGPKGEKTKFLLLSFLYQ